MNNDKDIIEKGYEKVKDAASAAYEKTKDTVVSLSESAEDKTFRERYEDMKSAIKEAFPSLTDMDLESVKGQKDKLIILLVEKYGETKGVVSEKLNRIISTFKDSSPT